MKENKTNTSHPTKDALGDVSNPTFNNPDALDSYRLEQLEMAMGVQNSMKLTPKLQSQIDIQQPKGMEGGRAKKDVLPPSLKGPSYRASDQNSMR